MYPEFSQADYKYIHQTLKLAAKGRGQVSPNPMVGALVVKDGKIVGRGHHLYATYKHGEINALDQAGVQAQGATLYVNLEPCCHNGRTPPCTDAILRSGIRRVVASMADPNPLVAGKGFQILQDAGVEVAVGLEEQAARQLNEKFISYIVQHRPFVHLKVAMSLDGKIATYTGSSQWITSELARQRSQLLRAEYDAILVGVGTVIADNPELTVRIPHKRHRPLVRVVLDRQLRTPLDSKLVTTATQYPLLIFASAQAAQNKHPNNLPEVVKYYQSQGAEVIFSASEGDQVSLPTMLTTLAERRLSSLIVEGGSHVSDQFVRAQLIDKVSFFIAPKLVGGQAAIPAIGGTGVAKLSEALELEFTNISKCGVDLEVTAYPKPKD